jgi:hypothetical protein
MGADGEEVAPLPSMQAADSGSAVAILCTLNDGNGHSSLTVHLIDGQTGALKWNFVVNASYSLVGVQVSSSGSHVLLLNQGESNMGYVLDGQTGALVDTLVIPSYLSNAAAISDTGDYVAFAHWAVKGMSNVTVLKLAADGKYDYAYDVAPTAAAPPVDDYWRPYELVISTGPAAADFLFVAYTPNSPTEILVAGYVLTTGACALSWATAPAPPTTLLQTLPAMRADADLVAVALWGNSSTAPTVLVLRAGDNAPLFTFTSPGSMLAVDLNVVPAAGGARTVFLGAAGSNENGGFGNGGDAYGWRLTIPAPQPLGLETTANSAGLLPA